jgi:hypothetical protein
MKKDFLFTTWYLFQYQILFSSLPNKFFFNTGNFLKILTTFLLSYVLFLLHQELFYEKIRFSSYEGTFFLTTVAHASDFSL